MTDKRELLPCPFCGGVAHRMPPTASINDPIKDGGRLYPIVRCLDCYCEVGGNNYDYLAHSAADKWNNRTHYSELLGNMSGRIACLKDFLAEICEVYAGMEGFHANTATEVYQQRIIYKMHEIAVRREDSGDA